MPKYTMPTVNNLLLLVTILIFYLSVSAINVPSIVGYELTITKFIYSWPKTLVPLFMMITQAGSGWALLGATTYFYVHNHKPFAKRLFLAGLATFMTIEVLKHMFGRARPYVFVDGIVKRDPLTSGGFGFPSGHAAMAGVLLMTLYLYLPSKYRPIVYVLAFLVCLSRIYLGMHMPLDVTAGFCVGVAIAGVLIRPKLLAKRQAKA